MNSRTIYGASKQQINWEVNQSACVDGQLPTNFQAYIF